MAGGCAPDDAHTKEAEERELEGYRAQAAEWIETYVARADALRVPRGHHVRAWALRHLDGRSIPEIRAYFAAHGLAPSVDGTSKWIERGRALVRELAFDDTDHERGEACLRAVGP